MQVLIAYASLNGSTREIAEHIAARLGEQGHPAVARSADSIEHLDGYKAFIIGSGIYSRAWSKAAAAFVERNREELARHPVWLFSVSSLGDEESFFPRPVAWVFRKTGTETKQIAGFRAALDAHGHRNFAGRVHRGDWARAGDIFLKALGGSFGDHRNWATIDAWTDGIATALRQENRAAHPLS